jgi:hypothetical protein
MSHGQQRYAQQANKRRRDVDFIVGDKVWVTTKNWKTDRPSRKFSDQMAGPFEILEQIGHSFKLRLPTAIRVHPVFHADRLRKDPGNPLPGQTNPEPEPLQVNDQEEYEVQEILAVRLFRGKKLRYKVKWKGWDDDPEWYPASALTNSPIELRRFHTANPGRPGPPRNIKYWLDCAEKDLFPEPRHDDDATDTAEATHTTERNQPIRAQGRRKGERKRQQARGRAYSGAGGNVTTTVATIDNLVSGSGRDQAEYAS